MAERKRKKAMTLFERWGMDKDMPLFIWRKKPDGTYGEEEVIQPKGEEEKTIGKSRKVVK